MDIKTLENFLKVADSLNFTRASETAYIAQPALSRQIMQLESTLDAKLFQRSKRKVELTEAGSYFREEVQKILSQFHETCRRTVQIHKGDAGEIRIGYTNSAMQTFLPEFIRQIYFELPKIRVILLELTNLQQAKGLEKHELDIGFSTNPLVTGALKSKVLLRDHFVVVLPLDHPVDPENFADLSVFAGEDLILPPKSESYYYVEVIESMCQEAGFIPRIHHETPFASTGLRLVEAGMGITIEPKSGLRGMSHRVKFIELKDVRQKAEITMVWHKQLEDQKPSLVQLMKNFHHGLPEPEQHLLKESA